MTDESKSQMVQDIARHQSRLRAFIRCLLIDPNNVDDLLQEVNLVIWEKANQFQPGTDFWAWASQIARFKVLNHIRSQKRNRLVFNEDFINKLTETIETKMSDHDDRRRALDQCLQKLPYSQRQLIDMRYSDECSMSDIAAKVGRPEGSIRQTLYRIRSLLLKCINSQLCEA